MNISAILSYPSTKYRACAFAAAAAALTFSIPARAFDYGDIPVDRMPPAGWTNVQWNDPGSWTWIDVSSHGLPPNDSGIDASVKIQEILAAYPTGNLLLSFPEGTYKFYSDLQITRSNVRLQGRGAATTQFMISLASTSVGGIGFVGPGFTGPEVGVTNSPAMGVNYVYADDTTFNTGDFVQLYLKNEPYGAHDNSGNYFHGQILKIASIDRAANKIVFTQKLGLDFQADYEPKLRKISMIQNVGIERVKIRRARQNDDGSFSVNNVLMRFVNNGYVSAVNSVYCGNGHISFHYCSNVVAEGNNIYGSFRYDGGYGYGIVAALGTTNARISNNKLWDLRHHIVLQKGANHCVISYNSLEPGYIQNTNSLCLHGHYSHNNLFEGNMMHQSLGRRRLGCQRPCEHVVPQQCHRRGRIGQREHPRSERHWQSAEHDLVFRNQPLSRREQADQRLDQLGTVEFGLGASTIALSHRQTVVLWQLRMASLRSRCDELGRYRHDPRAPSGQVIVLVLT